MYPDVSAFDDNVDKSSGDSLSDTLPEGQLVEQLRAATQEMTISTAGKGSYFMRGSEYFDSVREVPSSGIIENLLHL